MRDPSRTLKEQIEPDHTYRDRPPEPDRGPGLPPGMTLDCPGCGEEADEYLAGDQFVCATSSCRVEIFTHSAEGDA
jgi:hypothetical protein